MSQTTLAPKILSDFMKSSRAPDGISVKAGALGQFQAVSFVPREFFHSYIFNGTEPIVIVVALKDLYWVLGIAQDNFSSQGDIEEFVPLQGSFYESEQATIEYEKEGSTLNVELFDDTSSNSIEIVPLLQNPIGDIPEPNDRVMFFEMLCSDLKMILKDCIKTGSKFELHGFKHDIIALKFISRNESRFVENDVRAEACFQCRIEEDFQFTYSHNCIQPLLSLPVDKKSNIEVMIYRNGLMNLKFRPVDVHNSYVNYMVSNV
ncbi:1967_t:CDS:2 [Funneliformis mosseae]|uniref:1967_t:CDS:1 n=1 Tax=Funneliformis mosseae TaxID=27381 RepID=A0A9N9CSY5_FUNMO|nr:1967_t:CDS:2 [Funneliformis mosseae]